VLGIVVLAAVVYCLAHVDCSLLTPDQRAYRLFVGEQYAAAAERFADPMWRGVALFKQGQFEDAAGVFAGYDTAEAAFNHGNALVMQGKYSAAAERYARALELRPLWEDASVNRAIALGRAEMLRREGGDMTGGMLGADEIVFSDEKSPSSAPEEQVEGGQELSEAELRAVWLRQVQTKPADFLRAKFAHQHSRGNSEQ
jgi:Ca-activated chloride channel family protein